MDVQSLSWLWPAVAVAAAVIIAILWYFLRRYRARTYVDRLLGKVSHRLLRHVLIPDGMDGMIHLDYLLLTPEGLMVVDLKEVRGAIFGADKMDEWTVISGSKRFTFRNPLRPLQDRMAALRGLLPGMRIDGVVLFTGSAEFPKGMPADVVPVQSLAESRRFTTVDGAVEPPPVFLDAWKHVLDVSEPVEGRR